MELWLSLVALIQPWLIEVYKKFFIRGKMEVYEAGSIEIGYSNFGPTIGLNGTLKAENKDIFVQSMELEITRLRDQSKHRYGWVVFRPHRFRFTQSKDMEFELPAGFMVTTQVPHRYNILFSDLDVALDIRNELEKVSQSFYDEYNDAIVNGEIGAVSTQLELVRRDFYNSFSQQSVHVTALHKVDRLRYWDKGDYDLILRVFTKNPSDIITASWTFHLDDSHEKLLSHNSAQILHTACGVGTDIWYFAYCEYRKQK